MHYNTKPSNVIVMVVYDHYQSLYFRYEFITKDYDIGFGIYHKPLKSKACQNAGSMTPKVSHTHPSSSIHLSGSHPVHIHV